MSRRVVPVLGAVAALAAGLLIASPAQASPAQASPAQVSPAQVSPVQASSTHPHGRAHARPTAAVSLGDSYISGEAGRWKGNSPDTAPGHAGTDRAYVNGVVDKTLIYGATAANGCHRSDVAEIEGAYLRVQRRINLACSGAVTANVLRASSGGVAFKGEAPQDDQLLAVAKANRVRLITLSIGGNDLGFGGILTSCVFAYLFPASTPPCSTSQDALVAQRLPAVQAAVAKTLDDVRATMRAAGYRDSSYRLILQSYPTPSTRAARSRFAGDTSNARAAAGCPFLDVDADWSAGLSPRLSAVLGAAARSRGVQFLDLTNAFRGHELCAASTTAGQEWVRFIDLGGQGDSAESLHPNYYGQQALARCLTYAALTRHDLACKAVPNRAPWAVYPAKA